jgi:uncharacterized LabA/DUF88 family protein
MLLLVGQDRQLWVMKGVRMFGQSMGFQEAQHHLAGKTFHERLARFSSKERMDVLMAADAILFQNLTPGNLYVRGEKP